jgi:dihydroorotase-like cyclic amidohydrolase
VKTKIIDVSTLIERMSCSPARVFKLPGGTLKKGSEADITVFDPTASWNVDAKKFKSKGRNTPYAGMDLQGLVRCTIVGGRVVHQQCRRSMALRKEPRSSECAGDCMSVVSSPVRTAMSPFGSTTDRSW